MEEKEEEEWDELRFNGVHCLSHNKCKLWTALSTKTFLFYIIFLFRVAVRGPNIQLKRALARVEPIFYLHHWAVSSKNGVSEDIYDAQRLSTHVQLSST